VVGCFVGCGLGGGGGLLGWGGGGARTLPFTSFEEKERSSKKSEKKSQHVGKKWGMAVRRRTI